MTLPVSCFSVIPQLIKYFHKLFTTSSLLPRLLGRCSAISILETLCLVYHGDTRVSWPMNVMYGLLMAIAVVGQPGGLPSHSIHRHDRRIRSLHRVRHPHRHPHPGDWLTAPLRRALRTCDRTRWCSLTGWVAVIRVATITIFFLPAGAVSPSLLNPSTTRLCSWAASSCSSWLIGLLSARQWFQGPQPKYSVSLPTLPTDQIKVAPAQLHTMLRL